MESNSLETVVERIRRAVGQREGEPLSDAELLDRFIQSRDPAAFEALMRRHGPMVLAVCRRVLRNEADAEDALQATFVVLVRKASSITPRSFVGNWLYGVAYKAALKAQAMNRTRLRKERAARPLSGMSDGVEAHLQDLLDAALNALPAVYRVPIVLCELEGRSIKEAAAQLGWPQGTVASRLSRGRRRLAQRLTRLGYPLSLSALSAALSEAGAANGIAPALLSTTTNAALLVAAGKTVADAISAKVAVLTEGVMKSMLLTKLKRLCVGVLLAGLLCASAASWLPWAALSPAHGQATLPEREIKAQVAKLDKAGVWTFDFRFKDPRIIKVNVPGYGTRTFWYIWYQVVNRTGEPRRFVPSFELVTHDFPSVHHDDVLPAVEDAIRRIEDPTGYQDIKNSVSIGKQPIPLSKAGAFPCAVTGVAVWDAMPADPNKREGGKDLADCTRISIYVRGLSNGFVLVDPVTTGQLPITRYKTLQLSFRRHGDRFSQDSCDIAFQSPAEWIYRTATRKTNAEKN
ncbi:MAG: sigma-70 family RNA polymerase sigma factor [Gemmataceae bacterium]|nr:sigma-70 family RNA polymerase sigma factor [Gemmataceae bacterium]